MQNKDKDTLLNQRYDLDDRSKEAVKKLYKERIHGRFKSDRDGFTKAYIELSETLTYDKTKKLTQNAFNDAYDASPQKILREMDEERELMTYELAEQLTARVKEHLYMKERKVTDFAKPRRSETSIFNSQLQGQDRAISILQSSLESQNAEEEGFDKVAYQEIKAEIKKRREAKERLL